MVIKRLLSLAAAMAAVFVTTGVNAVLIGEWKLNGSLSEELGGPDAQISNPGGLGQTGYSFSGGDNLTLALNGLISADTYTIELLFSLDANDVGYQRIVSFDGLTGDEGQYAYDNYFYFYDESPDIDNFTFSPDELVTLRLSRDGTTDLYSAYLNGNHLWDFTDSSDLAVITESSMNLVFFQDDGSEHASGFIDNIRIYDDPQGSGTVPAPSTALLMVFGLVGSASFLSRRNKDKG